MSKNKEALKFFQAYIKEMIDIASQGEEDVMSEEEIQCPEFC